MYTTKVYPAYAWVHYDSSHADVNSSLMFNKALQKLNLATDIQLSVTPDTFIFNPFEITTSFLVNNNS